ncbi:MAG: 4-alpha-glucanotransferase [Gammaproteobacteria bacterium]|nr:4-alpha-glucanotransferase [Gammaproteobacteria bacterium]
MQKEFSKGALDRRRAGMLLHITSLPGKGATGDLGSAAYRFVDFLRDAGISVWQMLPTGPTQSDGSPYQSSSMHAGNPRLISLESLVREGWLGADALDREQFSDRDKTTCIARAWEIFNESADTGARARLERFIESEGYWLKDYALYRVLHEVHGRAGWWCWPDDLRCREPGRIARATEEHTREIQLIQFEQYQFFRQWGELKAYANERGVALFGDMPIFVAHDSAEVWARQELFLLDEAGCPIAVAGVPPDYFSATGQRWGNPLYRWDRMEQEHFQFWVERMQTQLRLFDLIRIDHFRGFESYWEIPAQDPDAVNGHWVRVPGDALFDRLHQHYDPLPLVAEDLGIITPEVTALRERYGFPGMKVLQFAFSGGADNPYLPFRHEANSVVYTGTHDNDTTLGWYLGLDDGLRQRVDDYLGHSREAMPWPMIRSALASRSLLAIIPMQDILALGCEHRMNLPGTTEGNWNWRFDWDQLGEDLPARIHRRLDIYGRLAAM